MYEGSNFSTFSPTLAIFLLKKILDILVGVKWYLSLCGFDLLSLVTNTDEYLFMFLLAFCILSLEIYLFKSFSHFLIGLFLLLSFKNYLCILDTRRL